MNGGLRRDALDGRYTCLAPAPATWRETIIEDETEDTEQAIRERAYHLWLEAGQPEHQHEEHWHRARELVLGSSDEPTPD